MTELQTKEFAILSEFVRVCEQLELTYYLVCGSALGAVKYGGFIPWDDDIDVALPRKDYETFLEKGQPLLPAWCFVQNHRTDPQFHGLGTKLRDSRTTYVEKMCEKLDIHHGVFIDVFPLDGQWKDDSGRRRFEREKKRFEGKRRVRLCYNRLSRETLFAFRTNFYYAMFRLFGRYADTARAIAAYDALLASYLLEESAYWCNYANSASETEYAPREQYGDGVMMTFEGLPVRVPARYDDYLTQKYGDWRAELPKEQQVGHHYYAVCDLDTPYTEYITRPNAKGFAMRNKEKDSR